MSVVKNIVLGLLNERPGYPYELARRFERRSGPAWRINEGHVYLAVAALLRQGLIEPHPSPVHDGPSKRRVMRLTPLGQEELERWFASPVHEDRGRMRSELTVKLLLTDRSNILAVLEDVERGVRVRIEETEYLTDSREPLSGSISWETALSALLNEAALAERISDLSWLQAVAQILAQLEAPRYPHSPGGPSEEHDARSHSKDVLASLRRWHDKLLDDVFERCPGPGACGRARRQGARRGSEAL
jgi:DNA-binding PadR family transcriptional regulator